MKSIIIKILLFIADLLKDKNTSGSNEDTKHVYTHTPYDFPEGGLSIDKYDEYFNDPEIRKAAFEKAWQIRNFEIEHYWKRAAYFWAFIAASFAGYIAIISSDKYPNNFLYGLEYYVICLGFIFSLAWCLVNWGSKKWQENWEGHIDRLEEKFTGPLYKVVRSGLNFSVSKINILVSAFIAAVWLSLGIQYLVKYFSSLNCSESISLHIVIGSVITLLAVVLFFTWGHTGSSHSKKPYYVRKIN